MPIDGDFIGALQLWLYPEGDIVPQVRVDMGEPVLEADEIPTTLIAKSPNDPVVNVPLDVADKKLVHKSIIVTCLSMGNPHCVTFVDEVNDDWVLGIGPKIEMNAHFPNRVNAEFVQVLAPGEVTMRVWERGTGETMACGTGASAVCVAGVLAGMTERRIVAQLPGGTLELEWGDDNHVYMTGPAEEVFSGDWNPSVVHTLENAGT